MEPEVADQESLPKDLGTIKMKVAHSFLDLCLLVSDDKKRGIIFIDEHVLDDNEERSMSELPRAFASNQTLQKLEFQKLDVDHILVAEALSPGIRNDKITSIGFNKCRTKIDQNLMQIMCLGLQERSTAFQLELKECSSEYVKPIIEASYLKCVSLMIAHMNCSGLQRPLKRFFCGNLREISMIRLKGLNQSIFLELARCVSMFPKLTKLYLYGTRLPSVTMKRLHGSLKLTLGSGKSSVLEKLDLGRTPTDERLSFAYMRLLKFDAIGSFWLCLKQNFSERVEKDFFSNIANTTKLIYLHIGSSIYLTSRTKFRNFAFQQGAWSFSAPFGVNPTFSRD